MAEASARRQGELVRGLFAILKTSPEGMPAKEALARLAVAVPPTPWEAADWPRSPGIRRFEKMVRFYTIDSVKAGWLVKDAGRWTVTEAGLEALAGFVDPEVFAREGAKLYRAWRRAQPKRAEEPIEPEAVEADAEVGVEEAREVAWEEVQSYLHGMPPYDFQELVAGLLKAMGYHVAWVAPPGVDAGVDILAFTDPLGASGPRIKVQVKRLESKVTADALRSFMAVLGEQDVGIYVAAGGFTSGAETEVRRQEKRKLTLIDLLKLYELWIQHQDRVPEPYRQLLPLTPVFYLDRRA